MATITPDNAGESRLDRAAASIDRVSATVDRGSSAVSSFGGAITKVSDAISAFGRLGLATLAGVVATIGACAYAARNLALLLTDLTGIPLQVTAAAMTALAAATIYAFVPTAALTAIWAGLGTVLGVVTTAATVAAGAIWAAVAPILVALAPIVLPVAAIAAALYAVYKVATDWKNIPGWLKGVLPVLYMIKIGVELILLPIRLVMAGWAAFKATVSAVMAAVLLPIKAVRAAIHAIPAVIHAIPIAASAAVSATGAMFRGLATAAQYAWQAIAKVGSVAYSIGASVVNAIRSAVQWTSGLLQSIAGGLASAGGTLQRWGRSIVDPLTNAGQQFGALGTAVARVSAQFGVSAAAAAVFKYAADATGQSIKDLIETMPEGSEQFKAWEREAKAMGLALDGPAQESAVALTIANQRLKDSWVGLSAQIGSAVAPALREAAELTASAVRIVTRWVEANKPLIASVFRVASAVATTGTVLVAFAGGLSTVATFLGPIVAGAAAAAAAWGLWRSEAGQNTWARWGGQIREAYAIVVDYGQRITAFAQGVIKGITDAIQGGDIRLAAEVASAGLQTAWAGVMKWMADHTGLTMGSILNNLSSGNWAAAGETASNAFQQAFVGLKGVADSVFTTIREGWNTSLMRIAEYTAKFLDKMQSSVLVPLSSIDPTGKIEKARVALLGARHSLAGYATGESPKDAAQAKAETDRMSYESLASQLAAGLASGVTRETVDAARVMAEQSKAAADAIPDDPFHMAVSAGIAAKNQALQDELGKRAAEREKELAQLRERAAELAKGGESDAAAKLAALQQRLAAAEAAAAEAKQKAELERKNGSDRAPGANVGPAAEQAAGVRGVASGTFSGWATAMSFGANDVQREQLATERQIAANTRSMMDVLRGRGLVFGA